MASRVTHVSDEYTNLTLVLFTQSGKSNAIERLGDKGTGRQADIRLRLSLSPFLPVFASSLTNSAFKVTLNGLKSYD
jgi:hypothetical protein